MGWGRMEEARLLSPPMPGPARAPSAHETAAAGGFTIAFCLEGQLRLDDQPALHEAVALARHQPGSRLVVLATRPEGQRLRGPHQRRIGAQALASLRSRLTALGIPLLSFPQQTTAAALDAIRPLLRPDRLFKAQQSRLFEAWPVAPERFPLVFSNFRRRLDRPPEAPLPPPDLSGLGWLAADWPEAWPREWLQSLDPDPVADPLGDPYRDPQSDPRSAFPFRGDEPTALARLQHFCGGSDGLRHYKARRNGLVGTEFSSKLSPFLALGSLSVRRIWQVLLEYQAREGADEGSEWLKQELLWREFFLWSEQRHGAAFHGASGLQNRQPAWLENRELFERWCHADGGHPLIDAQLRELLASGYLSNRGRQWVASHFINSLQLPWTWGARFFEWWLIDAEPALNTGNWAYLAGVGSDPRSFGGSPRRFDLERQVGLYDPEQTHRQRWS